VVKMVLAEPEIEPGGEQLVQISLRNRSGRAVRAGLRAEIRTRDNQATGIRGQRRVEVAAGSVRRVFLKLRVPKFAGEYHVRLVVLTPNFKQHLLTGKPEFASPFIVSGDAAPAPVTVPGEAGRSGGARAGVRSFKASGGLTFEKPDLLWENFLVTPAQLLVGETLKIKADLRNVGGDIARKIGVRSAYYNMRLPTRVLPVASSTVDLLAPGEKLEMEFEFRFPEDALLGDYQFFLEADHAKQVAESNEENNRESTARPIRVSTILLTFPEPGFSFDQTGLFLFRWKSALYNEFKVQVGTEASFESKDSFFDIPQGEKWARQQEVVPLPGEMPGMLLGLMMKDDATIAFWRVMGRVAGTSKVGFSKSMPFNIIVEEEVKPAAPGTAAPGTSGGGAPAAGRAGSLPPAAGSLPPAAGGAYRR